MLSFGYSTLGPVSTWMDDHWWHWTGYIPPWYVTSHPGQHSPDISPRVGTMSRLAYKLGGEGLIGVVVCLLAALQVQLFTSTGNGRAT